jgi:tetratricopeptide (TPR) repeat protein
MGTARLILCLCAGGLSLLAACRGCGQQEAAPVKVSEQAPLIEPKQLPPRTGPFSNPEKEPPEARSEPQLPPDELAAVLAEARDHLGKGEQLPAIQLLDRCANKVPQSVACEAELGIVLAESKRRKAHAIYYLEQAAMAPDADTELYRRVGATALQAARFKAAEAALGIVVARKEATAEDYGNYAAAVQGAKGSLELAIDAYLEGYALDRSRTIWLREAATLLSQIGDHERALQYLRQYAREADVQG